MATYQCIAQWREQTTPNLSAGKLPRILPREYIAQKWAPTKELHTPKTDEQSHNDSAINNLLQQ